MIYNGNSLKIYVVQHVFYRNFYFYFFSILIYFYFAD